MLWQVRRGLISSRSALDAAPSGGGGGGLDGSESDGTNILANSSIGSFSTVAATLTSGATTAPDGTTTAYSFIEDATADRHIAYQFPTFITGAANNTLYRISFYFKMSGRRYVMVKPSATDKPYAIFDLLSGACTETGVLNPGVNSYAGNASVQAGVNGFYKCGFDFKVDSNIAGAYLEVSLSNVSTVTGWTSNNDSPSYTGNGTSGCYIWRPKVV